MNCEEEIDNSDLRINKYNIETLERNVDNLNMKTCVNTQVLTAEFCVKYILNKDFQFTKEEQEINIETIKKYQPHLLDIDMVIKSSAKNLKKRIDSFEDFESYMNKNL